MTVHCAACGHQWELTIRLPIPLQRALLAMNGAVAAGCPECGAWGDAVRVGPKQP